MFNLTISVVANNVPIIVKLQHITVLHG